MEHQCVSPQGIYYVQLNPNGNAHYQPSGAGNGVSYSPPITPYPGPGHSSSYSPSRPRNLQPRFASSYSPSNNQPNSTPYSQVHHSPNFTPNFPVNHQPYYSSNSTPNGPSNCHPYYSPASAPNTPPNFPSNPRQNRSVPPDPYTFVPRRDRKIVVFGSTPGFYYRGCWYNCRLPLPTPTASQQAQDQVPQQHQSYVVANQAPQSQIRYVGEQARPLPKPRFSEQAQIYERGEQAAPLPPKAYQRAQVFQIGEHTPPPHPQPRGHDPSINGVYMVAGQPQFQQPLRPGYVPSTEQVPLTQSVPQNPAYAYAPTAPRRIQAEVLPSPQLGFQQRPQHVPPSQHPPPGQHFSPAQQVPLTFGPTYAPTAPPKAQAEVPPAPHLVEIVLGPLVAVTKTEDRIIIDLRPLYPRFPVPENPIPVNETQPMFEVFHDLQPGNCFPQPDGARGIPMDSAVQVPFEDRFRPRVSYYPDVPQDPIFPQQPQSLQLGNCFPQPDGARGIPMDSAVQVPFEDRFRTRVGYYPDVPQDPIFPQQPQSVSKPRASGLGHNAFYKCPARSFDLTTIQEEYDPSTAPNAVLVEQDIAEQDVVEPTISQHINQRQDTYGSMQPETALPAKDSDVVSYQDLNSFIQAVDMTAIHRDSQLTPPTEAVLPTKASDAAPTPDPNSSVALLEEKDAIQASNFIVVEPEIVEHIQPADLPTESSAVVPNPGHQLPALNESGDGTHNIQKDAAVQVPTTDRIRENEAPESEKKSGGTPLPQPNLELETHPIANPVKENNSQPASIGDDLLKIIKKENITTNIVQPVISSEQISPTPNENVPVKTPEVEVHANQWPALGSRSRSKTAPKKGPLSQENALQKKESAKESSSTQGLLENWSPHKSMERREPATTESKGNLPKHKGDFSSQPKVAKEQVDKKEIQVKNKAPEAANPSVLKTKKDSISQPKELDPQGNKENQPQAGVVKAETPTLNELKSKNDIIYQPKRILRDVQQVNGESLSKSKVLKKTEKELIAQPKVIPQDDGQCKKENPTKRKVTETEVQSPEARRSAAVTSVNKKQMINSPPNTQPRANDSAIDSKGSTQVKKPLKGAQDNKDNRPIEVKKSVLDQPKPKEPVRTSNMFELLEDPDMPSSSDVESDEDFQLEESENKAAAHRSGNSKRKEKRRLRKRETTKKNQQQAKNMAAKKAECTEEEKPKDPKPVPSSDSTVESPLGGTRKLRRIGRNEQGLWRLTDVAKKPLVPEKPTKNEDSGSKLIEPRPPPGAPVPQPAPRPPRPPPAAPRPAPAGSSESVQPNSQKAESATMRKHAGLSRFMNAVSVAALKKAKVEGNAFFVESKTTATKESTPTLRLRPQMATTEKEKPCQSTSSLATDPKALKNLVLNPFSFGSQRAKKDSVTMSLVAAAPEALNSPLSFGSQMVNTEEKQSSVTKSSLAAASETLKNLNLNPLRSIAKLQPLSLPKTDDATPSQGQPPDAGAQECRLENTSETLSAVAAAPEEPTLKNLNIHPVGPIASSGLPDSGCQESRLLQSNTKRRINQLFYIPQRIPGCEEPASQTYDLPQPPELRENRAQVRKPWRQKYKAERRYWPFITPLELKENRIRF
ncbi:titin isoform X2 [Drosophila biarmipes]|uniref:titin isoform X2 n=1 Tax=Drosophila biarmipes TaxID=125945 RepID=UPI0021CCD2D4|nr:titin isoform X2 [Drosophila biarmipes]